MALYYTTDLRGTINSLNFAVHLHNRIVSGAGAHSEALLCQSICEGYADFWDTLVQPTVSTTVNLTKVITEAYQEPTGFYELPVAILGVLVGDNCPPFVAKGFRQSRTNTDFRTSTHRFPEVLEHNNVNGNWVYDAEVTAPMISAIAEFLGNPQNMDVSGTSDVLVVQPVLIRTQYTTGSEAHPPKVTTFLDPHEISDVGAASFYGVTSQVSRKHILPS